MKTTEVLTYNKFYYNLFIILGLLGLIDVTTNLITIVIGILLSPLSWISAGLYSTILGIINGVLGLCLIWLILAYAVKKHNYRPFHKTILNKTYVRNTLISFVVLLISSIVLISEHEPNILKSGITLSFAMIAGVFSWIFILNALIWISRAVKK